MKLIKSSRQNLFFWNDGFETYHCVLQLGPVESCPSGPVSCVGKLKILKLEVIVVVS